MKTRSLILLPFILFSVAVSAQNSRAYIKEQIGIQGQCKNVAITQTNGDLMLYGGNGWAGMGLPTGLSNALHDLNNNNETLVDVQLTEYGSWLILYGNNGFRWDGIPYSLEQTIREWNRENEKITSVTFNDSGDWIVISERYIKASSQNIQNWLAELGSKYGQIYATCITDDAIVVCLESGYGYRGNVPQSLRDALKAETRDVYRIKIAGTSWFYADSNGSYRYHM